MSAFCLLLLVAVSPMQPVDGFVHALTHADTEELTALFTDDATVFMPMPSMPKRLEGKAAIREAFRGMLEPMRKPDKQPPYFRLEPLDVETRVYGDVAVITFHLTSPAAFSRRTFVLTRKDGKWLIAHLHASNVTVDRH